MERSVDGSTGPVRREADAAGLSQTITHSAAHLVVQAGRDVSVDQVNHINQVNHFTQVTGRDPGYRITGYPPTGPGVTPAVDGRGLPAQPSHLLDARFAIVDFTARDAEVRDLARWSEGGNRAVRWLHAPGGQGKTRIAGHVAGRAARAGWQVVTAELTAGRVDVGAPSTPDPDGEPAGLLLLVDYADRWPLDHLTSLFGDRALHRDVPVRVLLLARTVHVWPALRHALAQAGWPPDACTSSSLDPLPAADSARDRMFTAARDCFARHYRIADPEVIDVPDWLRRDEFGLTLAVHMAALVVVDRHARPADRPAAPESLTGLTGYLLDRERNHWDTMHDPARTRGGWATSSTEMARVVFTAALTGPLAYRDAKAVLDAVGLGEGPGVVAAPGEPRSPGRGPGAGRGDRAHAVAGRGGPPAAGVRPAGTRLITGRTRG
ncbi:hypothetical protein [Saccharothrix hoggarensis]|uniref:ATP-binding protein n=1 Tax=Saccharothrix hoggarensis TaxID=913853 RepID=A0ABW3R625_9PSEU